MSFFTLSDIGRIRSNNEDFAESFSLKLQKADGSSEEVTELILADGMGGGPAGECASQLAVSTIKQSFLSDYAAKSRQFTPDEYLELLDKHIQKAQLNIYKAGIEDPNLNGMGTTIVVGIVFNEYLSLLHVGDSRAYVFNGNSLIPQTKDHSLVQQYVDEGKITPEEAFCHPQRNIITRVLGAGSGAPVKADKRIVQLEKGDLVLFCTDGLCGTIEDNELQEVLTKYYNKENTDLKTMANALIQAACSKGGSDNITVVLYQYL